MKLTEIKPRNLDLSGEIPQRIRAVGLELEGGWRKLPTGCRGLTHDGSVNIPHITASARELELQMLYQSSIDPFTGLSRAMVMTPGMVEEYKALIKTRESADYSHHGELVSQAMSPDEVQNWMRQSYPSHVNATCGMHVHMSFKTPLNYQRLMTPEFSVTVIEEFKKWAERNLASNHHIWPRLRGESEYCQHLFFADDQTKWTRKEYDHHAKAHRYTVMNYCYLRHSTVECRLLPMMDTVNLAWSAIKHLMDITNAFLASARKMKEPDQVVQVIASSEPVLNKSEVWI